MSRRRRIGRPAESPPGEPAATAPAAPWRHAALAIVALLAAYLGSQYAYALRGLFVGDDYLFLEKTRHAGFLSLWQPRALAFHYYRPWSRELHYWVLLRLFGDHPLPYHLASVALGLAAGALYFLLVRRIAGAAAGATAVAAVSALASWGVLMVWAAGSQDLWMLVFALATLLAFTRGRTLLAVALQALALLSKETAAVVPGIALGYVVLVERRGLRAALRRVGPLVALVGAWAAFHPMLGGQIRHPIRDAVLPGLHQPVARIVGRMLLALVNLDEWPRPAVGWPAALGAGVVAVAMLGSIVVLGCGGAPWRAGTHPQPAASARSSARSLAAFGALWALLAWLPLLMPSLGWHAYYGLFGMLGAWLALAVPLARRPALALAVVAALAFLRSGRATTPSRDWGSEWFQARATGFGAYTRDFLRSRYVALPPHSRVYLANVPAGVGLVPGGEESPALRVWFEDPTLQTRFLSRYQLRAPGEASGRDYFFCYDSTGGWRELETGPEDLGGRSSRDTTWLLEHQDLARAMLLAGDWRGAAIEGRKLATIAPANPIYAFNLAISLHRLGRRDSAAFWYRRAAALPGADAAMQDAARRFGGGTGGGP